MTTDRSSTSHTLVLCAWLGVAGSLLGGGCTEASTADDLTRVSESGVALAKKPKKDPCAGKNPNPVACGQKLFDEPLDGVPEDNDRACATCHLKADGFALSPASVEALPANDPLFNRLDADDPNAAELTYEHLKRGLVRVKLELPPNTDLIAIPPSHPNPQQNLELAAAFTNTYDANGNVQVGSAKWWWDNLVVKGTHLCPTDRTPNEPVVHPEFGQQYEIVTPCDRKIEVWRAVPSVRDTFASGPFLIDGRAPTLVDQARGALLDHSEFEGNPVLSDLQMIAKFQQSLFTSDRSKFVSKTTKSCIGLPTGAAQRACLAEKPDPESIASLKPTRGMTAERLASWERGKVLYDQTCAVCHGSPTDDRIMNRTIHDALFPAVDADGTLQFKPDGGLVLLERSEGHEFVNIAVGFLRYASQLIGSSLPPGAPSPVQLYASDVAFPKYRMRFYTDATRSQAVADLPPLPFVANPTPGDFTGAFLPAVDPARGKLAVGPNLANQLYATDPGRALISGDYADFEGFDVPQLRGIAQTAPYFHDNQAKTLAEVVTFYSRNFFPFFAPALGLPPASGPGVDTLTDEQKADLVTFLEVF